MEKYRHVFERFATFDNMYDGYLKARKHKRQQDCVLQYTNLLEDNLIDSVNRLQWHEYHTGRLHQFYEYYPKLRLISSLPFYDRVINCAAHNVLWPIYRKSMYEYSFGSIEEKGPIRASRTVQQWMRSYARKPGDWYIVKMDIAKFFFRIPVDVQLRELSKPLDDPDMVWFLEQAIRCDGRPLGLPVYCTDVTTAERISGIGMQVGSLISQMTANVVMTPTDYYIKRELEMHMKRRHDKPVRVVLPFRQLAGQIPDMMIVNQAQHARRVRSLGMQRILHQRVTDDVAQRLGTAWASLPFAQGIKLLKQIAIQRNAETNRFSHCRTLYR